MSVKPNEPKYFDLGLYNQVKNSFKPCDLKYDSDGRFDKIISKIPENTYVVNWEDKIFTCLHHFLSFNNGFLKYESEDFCRYINFWLNGEVIDKKYEIYRDQFNIFQKFSHEFQKIYANNDSHCCEKYIYKMENDEYNRMKFLYDFFDMYNSLKSSNYQERTTACNNLLSNANTYNDAIDNYYDHHRDLYYKIRYAKNLIEDIIKKPNSECKQNVYFRKPRSLVEEERQKELKRIADEQRKQEEEAERQKQREAEAESQRQRDAEAERQRTKLIQQEIVSHRGMQQMHTTHDAQHERFHQVGSRRSLELENSGEALNLETQQPLLQQQHKDQSEQIVHTPGKEYTNSDGSFLRLSGVSEEEDAHMEFLEASMDNSLEDFQDMKSFMM
ncbi:hypothetical protein PVIIG_06055 [Plasmodium vivax India VII]|uniref:VIR protein n=1 Tax=Plasmodium vivax India VII TaxID=1077284 RepID=A0A0J9SHE3_PLAVI|nr:hypothetical protein PVIIG_06055 [Plasmodium vivax India VII]